MTDPTTSELIEMLRSAHMPMPVEVKAVYRTRPVALFEQAADALADLERERDLAKAESAAWQNAYVAQVEAKAEIFHEREAAERSIQEARGVIAPFAEAADDFPPDDADTMRPATVQARHFRRARAFLSSEQGGDVTPAQAPRILPRCPT